MLRELRALLPTAPNGSDAVTDKNYGWGRRDGFLEVVSCGGGRAASPEADGCQRQNSKCPDAI
jgi:hypothetical protein